MNTQKLKNICMEIAIICSAICIIWSIGRLTFHDIPALFTGYEEIAIETIEDTDQFGMTNEVVTKTVKKEVSAGEAFSYIVENVLMLILSAGVIIAYPIYKDSTQ